MDWNLAIERNREALKRIVAMLVAMAGLGNGHSAIAGRQSESEPAQAADGPATPDCQLPTADCRVLLPRHRHRAVLRLLRPAESAARRLVIVMARGLVVALAADAPAQGKTGVDFPAQARRHRHSFAAPALGVPLPLVERGWGCTRARRPSRCSTRSGRFAPGRSGPSRTAFPASRFRASPRRFPLRRAARRRPTIRSTRPASRSASRRWARRWTTCRDTQSASRLLPATRAQNRNAMPQARSRHRHGRIRRVWPLRPGRPPGQRPANRRAHEVHEILHDLHGLAFDVLEHPDTS